MLFLGLMDERVSQGLAEPFKTAASACTLAAVCVEAQVVRRPVPEATQAQLAALAAMGPFLSATPGLEVESPQAALRALGPDLTPYEAALARFGLWREHRVGVVWDARATLRAFVERDAPELALARAFGRDRFGVEIVRMMARERRRLADWIFCEIRGGSRDALAKPCAEGEAVAEVVALLGPQDRPRFEAALAQVAAAMPGKPRIGCGPALPAASFAGIERTRDGGATLRLAVDRAA